MFGSPSISVLPGSRSIKKTAYYTAEAFAEKKVTLHSEVITMYYVNVFLNIMFNAPIRRFQLNQNFELPLFSVFTVVPFNCCVHSCRPFVAITSSAGLDRCRGFYWSSTVNYQGRATVETNSTPSFRMSVPD